MSSRTSQQVSYIIIDFDKVWRFVPMTRPGKEMVKWILFSTFPYFFKKLAVYQNWKTARVFAENNSEIWSKKFWKRIIHHHYNLNFYQKNTAPNDKRNIEKIAIVLHVFYLDVFLEIIDLLKNSDFQNFKLFITTPEFLKEEISIILKAGSFQHSIFIVDNRGRDVLPFLKILQYVFDEGYELILKIHTKRSNHLKKRDLWKDDLFNKIIGKDCIGKVIQTFNHHQEIGMIGPLGHILPMALYYGGNAQKVLLLSLEMGLKKEQLQNLHFTAGTMFYARKEALIPVLNLGLTDQDFEPENNQLDGTLAHALERAITSSLLVSGLKLADTSSTPENVSCRFDKNYKFTL